MRGSRRLMGEHCLQDLGTQVWAPGFRVHAKGFVAMSRDIVENRWKVASTAFATRVAIPDMKGFFGSGAIPSARTLVIEPGTRSVIIDEGIVVGELLAGDYTLESFAERLTFWRNKQATVFLTRSEDVPIEGLLKGLPCLEGVCFDLAFRWTVQAINVLHFMENLMGAHEQVSLRQLEEWISPIVHQAIRDSVGQMEYSSLQSNNMIQSLADAVRSRIEVKLARYGLRFNDLQFVLATARDGGLAEASGEQWIASRELQVQRAAREIENEQLRANAEDMGKKIDLRLALRKLVAEDTFNKIKGREELEKSIDEIDRAKLLRMEEREQLIAAFEERKDDRSSLRKHLLDTLDIQREQEIEEMRLAMDHAVRVKSLSQEIELSRKSRMADAEVWRGELEKERQSAEHRRQIQRATMEARWDRIRDEQRKRREDSWEALVHAQRTEGMRAELEISRRNRHSQLAIVQAELESRLAQEKLEIRKRQDLWEFEAREKKSNSQLDRLQRLQEINSRFAEQQQRLQLELENLRSDGAAKRELDRLQTMQSVSVDVLIASSSEANAAILADLKKHQASQDTAKLQASLNPAAELNAERLKMYEQLNATERAKADAIAEAYRLAMEAQSSNVGQMINGLAQAATPVAPPPVLERMSQAGAANTRPATFAGGPPAIPVESWYYAVHGKVSSPHSWNQFQDVINAGSVTAESMVWKSGMSSWTRADKVPELSRCFRNDTSPPPPPPPDMSPDIPPS
jgi:hypothetical protein